MQAYLSVDMEGIGGVVHVEQTRRGGHDYERARRWMTAEANAAIEGAFDGGASAVLVNDSHGDMRNLILDELDPRVELVSGALKPLSMVQGVSERFQVALFVGYHAGAGTRAAILDHTYFGRVVARLRVDGRDFPETGLNALVCGAQGVPIGLVTGDRATCEQARAILGEVETVAVKEGISRAAARCLPLATARERVRAGARRALERAAAGELRPFVLPAPHGLEVDFVNSACADAAELVPGTLRMNGLTTRYEAPDARTLIQVVQAWTKLAGTTMS